MNSYGLKQYDIEYMGGYDCPSPRMEETIDGEYMDAREVLVCLATRDIHIEKVEKDRNRAQDGLAAALKRESQSLTQTARLRERNAQLINENALMQARIAELEFFLESGEESIKWLENVASEWQDKANDREFRLNKAEAQLAGLECAVCGNNDAWRTRAAPMDRDD